MQKFRASSMREAMTAVKEALGPEAVILATHELGGDWVEIQAALDPEPDPAPVAEAPRASVEDAWFMPDPESMNSVHAEIRELRRELSRLRADRAAAARSQHQWGHVVDEVRALGKAMGVVVSPDSESDGLVARLVKGGVDAGLARSLTSSLDTAEPDSERVLSAAVQIQEAFEPAPSVWDRKKHTVAAFVGPTGVGKTTTLAKIAANAALYHGMSVALVAADTYRIGAVEQVKTYAELIGCPVAVATNRADLAEALQRFEGYDLVLVDTAGGSPWAAETMERLDALLGGFAIERHLCVTAGTSGADLADIVGTYSKSGIRSIVVTKMDEARSVGGVLSTVWGTDYQIAHVTTGQKVPGDIETVSPARMCQAVLG